MVKNPLLNEDYCYHSIGGDVFRMESILKHGILSQSELSKTGMPESSMGGAATMEQTRFLFLCRRYFVNLRFWATDTPME